jgi:ABC-type Fe3+ transport system substrate-binding protein
MLVVFPCIVKLADYILSPKGQQVLQKYGFISPTKSVPEPNGVGGLLIAAGIAFAVQRKLASHKVKTTSP